jgi:lysophospholipase L1-like esterase
MTTKKLTFSMMILLLTGYLVAVFFEFKLQKKKIELSTLSVENNSSSRYISIREIDPYFELELGRDKSYNFHADHNGFIEPSGIYKIPDFNIVFLGGSTTECFNVKEKLRFPYLTGQLLEKKTGFKCNTYNGGRSGNNSLNSYVKLLNIVVPMKPDYVIMMHTINDLINSAFVGSYWSNENKNRFMVSTFDSISTYDQSVSSDHNQRKILPYTIKAFKRIKHELFDESKPTNEWSTVKSYIIIDTTKIFNDFRSSLNTFVHTCTAWNIEPILMTQHNQITMDIEESFSSTWINKELIKSGLGFRDFIVIYNKMNNIIREVAIKNNISYIDLDKYVPRNEVYMSDHVHLNNEGSQLVAKIISDSLYSKLVSTYRE